MVYVLVSEESVSDRKAAIFWRDRPVTRPVRQIEPATAANGGANQFLDSVPDCPDARCHDRQSFYLYIHTDKSCPNARLRPSCAPLRAMIDDGGYAAVPL